MNTKNLQKMNPSQWDKFLLKVGDLEEADMHLTTEERKEVVAEFVRRNPGTKLTGDLDNDFVDLVLC